jgi:trimeric autotransporter adhesin
MMNSRRLRMALVVGTLAGCGGSSGSDKKDVGVDGRPADTRPVDAATPADTAPVDTRPVDTAAPADMARPVDVPPADRQLDVPPADGAADAAPDLGRAPDSADVGADLGLDGVPADAVGGDAAVDTGDASSVEQYVAALSGAQEVPVVDTAATGAGTFSYDPATRTLTWNITHDVDAPTVAHIHDAAPGENSAPIVTLTTASPITGTAILTADQERDLRLGHLYTNVHSATAPNGEIRGQILRPGDTVWVAQLRAAEEVQIPPVTSTGTGTASVIVNSAHTSAHIRLTTSLTPTAAHVHTGIAGENGDPRFTLALIGSTSEADVAFTEADFIALERTELYANVHTTAFPAGELRGQLLPPGVVLYGADLTGGQEVPAPAVVSTATGIGSVILAYRSTDIRYALVTTLTPTLEHIHRGAAGVAGDPIVTLTNPTARTFGTGTLTAPDVDALDAEGLYFNVHTTAYPDGEIRGQITRISAPGP